MAVSAVGALGHARQRHVVHITAGAAGAMGRARQRHVAHIAAGAAGAMGRARQHCATTVGVLPGRAWVGGGVARQHAEAKAGDAGCSLSGTPGPWSVPGSSSRETTAWLRAGRVRCARSAGAAGDGPPAEIIVRVGGGLRHYWRWPRKPFGVSGISGLVVEYIVAIDVTRARFPADAFNGRPAHATSANVTEARSPRAGVPRARLQ